MLRKSKISLHLIFKKRCHLQSFARELLEAGGAGGRVPGAEGSRSGSRCAGSSAGSDTWTVPLTPLPGAWVPAPAAAGRRDVWQQVDEPITAVVTTGHPTRGRHPLRFPGEYVVANRRTWMPLGLGTRVDTSGPRDAQRHCPPAPAFIVAQAFPGAHGTQMVTFLRTQSWGDGAGVGEGGALAISSLKLSPWRSRGQLHRVCFPPVAHGGESRRNL